MILLVHMLLGAAVGHIIKNKILAIILAVASHYFLDVFPHIEYNIGEINKKQLGSLWRNLCKASIDAASGLFIIIFLTGIYPIILICAAAAILPDFLTVIDKIAPFGKWIKQHTYFHCEKVHFLKNKKIPLFWRIFSQVIFSLISVAVLALT